MKTRLVAVALSLVAIAACSVSTTSSPTPTPTPTPTPPAAGDGGADGGGDGCGVDEPNDTRETAKVVDLDASYPARCVGGADEHDFFEFTAPAADLAGGYVQVQLRNVVNGWINYRAYAVDDNGLIVEGHGSDEGANADGFFTVAPGKKYRVDVSAYVGSTTIRYDVELKYTKLDDAFEPNDTPGAAKPITVGTPIQASAAPAAARAAATEEEQHDWYKLTLAAGTGTVRVTNVPSDFWLKVNVFDSSNSKVAEAQGSDEGANVEVNLNGLVAGEYSIQVEPYVGGGVRAGDGAAVPPRIGGQYTLAVTQP